MCMLLRSPILSHASQLTVSMTVFETFGILENIRMIWKGNKIINIILFVTNCKSNGCLQGVINYLNTKVKYLSELFSSVNSLFITFFII